MEAIEMSRIEKQKIGRTKRIINFKNYIGAFFRDTIKIFELNDNLDINLKNSFSTGKVIENMDFNSKYKDILLTIPANDYIKLYNISNQNNFEVISILNGESTKDAHYAKFNPTNENLIISSKDKIIDIWDITKYTNIKNIQSKKIIYNLTWDISGNYFGYITDLKGLNVSDNDNKNIITIDADNINSFEFINNQDLITFHNDSMIKKWDIRYYNNPKLEIKDLYADYELYDKNNDYIYIKNDLFQIYKSDNLYKIHEEEFDFYNNPIILDSHFLKNNEIANMAEQGKNGKFNIIKIVKKNKSTFEEKNDQNNIKEQQDFINNIVYKISNYENFSDYINQKKDVYYRNKNYLEIDEIKTEINLIGKVSLPDRKKYVKDVYDGKIKVNPFKDKIDEYIHYIKLLIRDNTNKSLLKDYLQFLEKNEIELSQKISLENYKDEVEFYKVCFNKKEYMENFGLSKEKSEKESLVDFLIQIKDSKDINQFIGLIKNIKSMVEYPYFNQPINGENEELLFFKSKLILYNEISSIDYKKQDELFLSQKKIIEEILKNQYLENYNIFKNYDIIFLLIALIVYPESDEEYNKYILNLLNSFIPEKEINEINEINEIITELEKHKDSELLLKVIGIKDNPEKICKRNLKAYLNKDIETIINKKSDLYIFDDNWKEKCKEMDLIKIKNFLKEILKKEMFKNIFSILYKEEDLKIINQNYFIDDYIDNHLFLVPYKNKNFSGLTDRFSCNSYIFFCEDILSNNNSQVDNIVTYALKTSRFIIITLHEFNHYIYSYILHSNNYINLLFDSPRKKELIINEGGLLMELFLFGDEISDINLEQTIYILDEKNYDKTEKQFQKEFINIGKSKKLYINGNYYSSFNINILSQKDFQYKRNITIKTKMKKLNSETYKRLKNCVL